MILNPHYLDWYGDEVREFVLFPAGVHDDLDSAAGGQDTRPGWTSDSNGAICSLNIFSIRYIVFFSVRKMSDTMYYVPK